MTLEHTTEPGHDYHSPPAKEMEHFRDHANLPISLEGLENLCTGDETLESLFTEMRSYCTRYAEDVLTMDEFVVSTPLSSRDESWKSELVRIDEARTRLHNAVIDSINILSRNLREKGRSNEWLRPIAAGGRSAYARFAIALAFSYYLSLRKKVDYE